MNKRLNNRIILLCAVLCVLLLAPVAFAEDSNSTADNNIYVSVYGSNANNGSIDSPYQTIGYAISHVDNQKSSIIVSEGTYKENGITIEKNLSITGQGLVIIDGSKNSGIFRITDSSKCVLNNLTIINGYYPGSGHYGGAISNNGETYLNNIKFINNSAYGAGAVDNTYYLSAVNCYFENNEALQYDAGALSNSNSGYASLINCTFLNNRAYRDGGAVKNYGGYFMSIVNSSFIKNSANGSGISSYGGALYLYNANTEIDNTTFYENTAVYGGAIFTDLDYSTFIKATGLTIINNHGTYGGALYERYQSYGKIEKSIFLNNSATFGSAIAAADSADIIIDNNWWGNTEENPTFDKSVLYMAYAPDSYLILTSESLENATIGEMTQISVYFKVQPNDNFTGEGLPDLDCNITSVNGFTNQSSVKLINGQAVIGYTPTEIGNNSVTFTVNGIKTTVNVKVNPLKNVVYVDGVKGSDSNSGNSWDKAVKTFEKAYSLIGDDKNTIYIAEGTYDLYNIKVNKNLTVKGFGDVILDACLNTRIFHINTNNLHVLFDNLIFMNVASSSQGAAIMAAGDNGYLSVSGYLTVQNCKFINTTASGYVYGSGIYNMGDILTVINSTFINNTGGFNGALFTAGNTVIDGCYFINNTASASVANWGGAVRTQSGTLDIINSVFMGNKASQGSAVEIFANGMVKDVNINYCIFEGFDNATSLIHKGGTNSLTYNMDYNYFGTNSNPNEYLSGFITKNWTLLNIILSQDKILAEDIVNLNIDFTKYTDGNNTYTLNKSMPNVKFTFEPTIGKVNPNSTYLTNGKGTISYTSNVKGDETLKIFAPFAVDNFEFSVLDKDTNTIYVSILGDDLTGDGSRNKPFATIAKAVEQNHLLGGSKTIYILNGSYIASDLNIVDKLNIIGENTEGVLISSSNNKIIFNNNASLSIENLTLLNGKTGILNNGILTLINDNFMNFTDSAIKNYNSTNVKNSNFINNTGVNGGAIYSEGDLTSKSNTFKNNTASVSGGAIYTKDGKIDIESNIFESNKAGEFGYNVALTNSTTTFKNNIMDKSNKNIYLKDGTISNIILTFNDNQSTSFELKKVIPTLNVVVSDDMGNAITGGNVTFTANGKKIASSTVNEGIANYTWDPDESGLYVISGIYDYCKNPKTYTATFDIYQNYWFVNGHGYKTLDDAIDAAEDGDAIEGLSNTYYYTSTILVNKNVTILPRGNASIIIDGSKGFAHKIFNVYYDKQVTFKDITIQNGYNDDDGGAIYNHGILSIINCTFINNTVVQLNPDIIPEYNRGGAIFNWGGEVYVYDSLFYENVGPTGGAIYSNGDNNGGFLFVNNTRFIKNVGTTYNDAGGAITIGTRGIIANSTFDGNTALNSADTYAHLEATGGAIHIYQTPGVVIDSCKFINNKAAYWAGAIHASGSKTNITNCLFENNTAGKSGGAIFTESATGNDIDTRIINSTFINNTAGRDRGGAIDADGDLLVDNSVFMDNSAKLSGGAIYAGYNKAYIYNSIFVNNNAPSGGAIDDYHNTLVATGNYFYRNNASRGGAILTESGYLTSGTPLIANNTFIENNASYGGAYAYYASKAAIGSFKFISNIFDSNTAEYGSALYTQSGVILNDNAIINNGVAASSSASNYVDIEDNWWGTNNPNWASTLENISAPVNYAVLKFSGNPLEITTNGQSKLTTSFVWKNGLTENIELIPNRTAIFDSNGGVFADNYIEFNTTLNNMFKSLNSGIFNVSCTVDNQVLNITIKVNGGTSLPVVYVDPINGNDFNTGDSWTNSLKTLESAYGLVSNNGQIYLGNGTIFKTSSNPIEINKNIDIIGMGIDKTVIDLDNTVLFNIAKNSTVNINDLMIINGLSSDYGGAIINNGNLTIDSVKFTNNTAYGTACIDNVGKLIVKNSEFSQNTANGRDCGVISSSNYAEIINCTFDNNNAVRNGGAIKNYDEGTMTVINSTFTNNTASGSSKGSYGGAIYVWNSNINIANCTFINNSASDKGGAVYFGIGNHNKYYLNVTGSLFDNNSAVAGGAIYSESDLASINYNGFVDNSENTIYTTQSNANINYNWWASNNPVWSDLLTGIDAPDIYAILNFTAADSKFAVNNPVNLEAKLLWNNQNDDGISKLPLRDINIETVSTNVSGKFNNEFDASVTFNKTGIYDIKAIVDNEVQVISVNITNGVELNIDVSPMVEHENGTVIITTNPSNATGTVKFTIDNKEYIINLVNGYGSCNISDINAGNYSVLFVYDGGSEFGRSEKLVNITVSKFDGKTTIIADDLVMYYRNGSVFIATLSSNGKALAGEELIIELEGYNYTRTTDALGQVSLNINLRPSLFTVNIYYNGNGKYNSTNTSSTIRILSTVSGNDLIKTYRNDSQYCAYFVDGQGNPLTNTKVSFNIDGVFYQRTTDDEGKAILNINLRPGNFIITALNPVNNQMYSNNITVLSSIESHNLVKYYRNGSQYSAKFFNLDGSPLANKDVSFNIDGVIYHRTTNEEGIATVIINLRPGEYIITAENPVNNELASSKITVKPILIANDLYMKYRDGSKFTALLLDGQGKPLANKEIQFNIDGVFYYRTTDENGIASLNINLRAGTFIVTSTYNAYSTSNKIVIS